jgi:hypothetical protein
MYIHLFVVPVALADVLALIQMCQDPLDSSLK